MRKSLIKDQRGVGHIVLIMAILVIAVAGFAGWRVTQKDDTNSSSQTAAEKAAVSECKKVYKDDDLCKFTGNYDIEKLAYKMELTTTSAQGNSTGVFLSDGKGNSQTTMTGGGTTYESIYLNKVTYLKDNTDGKWTKYPANDTTAPKEENPVSNVKTNISNEKTKDTITYKKLGKEKCGKLNCFKYQVIDSSQPNLTLYLWFDDQDYRMAKFYSKDAEGTTEMVITYQSVKISEPSPVKEFDANAGMDSAAYQQALQQYQSQVGQDTAE